MQWQEFFTIKVIIISYDWAVKLYSKANELGYRISLDTPHNGYTWHMHISGANSKLLNLHIQIEKSMGLHCKTVKVRCYYGTV